MDELIQGIDIYINRVMTYNPVVVAVEFFLIGLVVYLIMRFLKGTRGARLIKGVGVMLALVYLVLLMLPKQLEWDRITYLYGNLLIAAFVAVIVAFQPELRRAFIQLGQAHFLRGKRGRIEEIIENLCDASAYLSRNKIGALIAVERQVGLGALMATGSTLDANLSSSLLKTIFYPGSALHDMGVVVREDRIAAAGCQFPLAESDEVDPSLGSRHRAALGLSKDSDAVVLVVSEETGRISIACEGQLHIGLEAESLRQMLLSLLTPKRMLSRFAQRKDARTA